MSGFSLIVRAVLTYLQLSRAKKIAQRKNFFLELGLDLRVLSRLFCIRAPLFATIGITHRCPLSCWHCSLVGRSERELSLEQLKNLARQLDQIGTCGFGLTGGEPFLRKDLVEIISSFPRLAPVFIYSSGAGLKEETARELARFKNLAVVLSLDHSQPEVHNQLRGNERAWDWVFTAKEILQAQKIPVHFSTVVTRERLLSGEFEEFCYLIKEKWGVNYLQVFLPRPVGKLTAYPDQLLSSSDLNRFKEILERVLASPRGPFIAGYPVIESRELLGCCGGFVRIYISPQGDFYPCDFNPVCFGNVLEEPVSELWSRARSYFRYPRGECFIQRNWKNLSSDSGSGKIDFIQLEGKEDLLALEPALIYQDFGLLTYRFLAPHLYLATVGWLVLRKQGKV